MSKGIIITEGSCSLKLINLIKLIDESTSQKKVYLTNNSDDSVKIYNTDSQSDYWRALGKIYGYKSCCIEEYIHDCLDGRIPMFERKSYNGYVPCSKCLAECNETELAKRGSRGSKLKKLIFINNKLLEL